MGRRYRSCSNFFLQNILLSVEKALSLLSFAFGNMTVCPKSRYRSKIYVLSIIYLTKSVIKSLPFKKSCVTQHLFNNECDKVATVQKSMYYFGIPSSLDSLLTELFESSLTPFSTSLIASFIQLVFHSLVCQTGYQSPVTCYSKH